MKQLRIVFWGTPDLGIPVLEALHASPFCDVVGVVSQPDKPQGRKHELLPTPIKACAMRLGISVFQPEKLQNAATLETLRAFDADFFVVMAYGKIVKQEILDIPRIAPVNIHVSLLPKHRGASPIQASLRAGDASTGVTFMRMTAGMDEGPILAQYSLPIEPTWHAGDVFRELSALSRLHVVEVLQQYAAGTIKEQEQIHEHATPCHKITKEMGQIDWKTHSAQDIYRMWQAYTPWPGIYTFLDGKRVKLLKMLPAIDPSVNTSHTPGEIFSENGKVYISALEGVLELISAQTEGKKATSALEWSNGITQKHFE